VTHQDRRALQELLLSAVEAGWDPDGPEIAAAFGEDHEALAEAREWLHTHAAYERLALDEKALVEEVYRDPVDEADRALAEDFFREHRPASAVPRPRLHTSFPPWQLVAGLLLLIAAGFWIADGLPTSGPPQGEQELFLGSAPIGGLSPSGAGASFERFRWDPVELPPGGSYRLIVEHQGREILRAGGLKEASLETAPAQRAELEKCEEIEWRVYALGADRNGAPLAFGSAQASQP